MTVRVVACGRRRGGDREAAHPGPDSGKSSAGRRQLAPVRVSASKGGGRLEGEVDTGSARCELRADIFGFAGSALCQPERPLGTSGRIPCLSQRVDRTATWSQHAFAGPRPRAPKRIFVSAEDALCPKDVLQLRDDFLVLRGEQSAVQCGFDRRVFDGTLAAARAEVSALQDARSVSQKDLLRLQGEVLALRSERSAVHAGVDVLSIGCQEHTTRTSWFWRTYDGLSNKTDATKLLEVLAVPSAISRQTWSRSRGKWTS